MEREGDGTCREDGDVDRHRQPMETRELQRGEVSGRRHLGAESGGVRLRQEDVPRIQGAGQGDAEEGDRAPTERTWVSKAEDQGEGEGDTDGDEAKSVVPGEHTLHHPHRHGPVNHTERGRSQQEGQKDLDPEASSQEGRRKALENPHLTRMIRVGGAPCQGARWWIWDGWRQHCDGFA